MDGACGKSWFFLVHSNLPLKFLFCHSYTTIAIPSPHSGHFPSLILTAPTLNPGRSISKVLHFGQYVFSYLCPPTFPRYTNLIPSFFAISYAISRVSRGVG